MMEIEDLRAALRIAEAERDEAETVITTLLLLADDAEQVHSKDSTAERLRKVYLLILRHWRHIETDREQAEADELNASLRGDLAYEAGSKRSGSDFASRTVETAEQLEGLPVGSIVRSAAGTVAARFDETKFVCFGDDRPGEPWSVLALPAAVLFVPPTPEEPYRVEKGYLHSGAARLRLFCDDRDHRACTGCNGEPAPTPETGEQP